MTRAPAAALLALVTLSCGRPLMKLPAGPGTPAPDAAAALAEATAVCRVTTSIRTQAAVSGSIAGQRVRAELLMGLASPSSARLEAYAFGQRVFTFVSEGDSSILLLEQDRRVLDGAPPDAVLEALTGVPVGPGALRVAVTGCSEIAGPVEGEQLGPNWRRIVRDATAYYLNRRDSAAPWRLVAASHRTGGLDWRAEYARFAAGLPGDVRLVGGNRERFDIRLELKDTETNVPLGPEVFQVRNPSSYVPMTLAELRRTGPFAVGANDR